MIRRHAQFEAMMNIHRLIYDPRSFVLEQSISETCGLNRKFKDQELRDIYLMVSCQSKIEPWVKDAINFYLKWLVLDAWCEATLIAYIKTLIIPTVMSAVMRIHCSKRSLSDKEMEHVAAKYYKENVSPQDRFADTYIAVTRTAIHQPTLSEKEKKAINIFRSKLSKVGHTLSKDYNRMVSEAMIEKRTEYTQEYEKIMVISDMIQFKTHSGEFINKTKGFVYYKSLHSPVTATTTTTTTTTTTHPEAPLPKLPVVHVDNQNKILDTKRMLDDEEFTYEDESPFANSESVKRMKFDTETEKTEKTDGKECEKEEQDLDKNNIFDM